MSELTLTQKKKLMTIAEIEILGNRAITKYIIELQDLLDKTKQNTNSFLEELKSETKKESSLQKETISQVETIQKQIKSISEFSDSLKTKIDNLHSLQEESCHLSVSSINEISTRLAREIENIKSLIPQLPDLALFEEHLMANLLPRLEEIRNEIPVLVLETPESIKDKLETLKDDERLDKSAIKGLEDLYLEVLALKNKKPLTIFGGGGSTSGKIVKYHDLSSQLDGVTKTFSLPAFYRVLQVIGGSFPIAYRPDVDYTIDGSAFTITFTSQIIAESALAVGQTLLVLYSEL